MRDGPGSVAEESALAKSLKAGPVGRQMPFKSCGEACPLRTV